MRKTIILLAIVTLMYIIGLSSAFSYLFKELTVYKFLDLIRNIIEYSIMFLSVMIFCSILLRNKFTSVIAYIFIVSIALNFGLAISAALIYKSDVNIGMVLSILDSNFNEAVSMSSMFILPSLLGLIMLSLLLYTAIKLKKSIRFTWKIALISTLWILMPFAFFSEAQIH